MKLEDWVLGGYLLGIPLDWAYWVARGLSDDVSSFFIGAAEGIVPAVFWPLHVLVEAWFWILT